MRRGRRVSEDMDLLNSIIRTGGGKTIRNVIASEAKPR
jgi:hypothetical protein